MLNMELRSALIGGLVCASTLAMAADLAPPEAYEGRAVAAIRWDPPTQPVASADLARILPLQPGTPLHIAIVRDAIKRLFATGQYSNIEFEIEPSGNGVVLIIRTTEQWFVGPVEVRGRVNTPPSEGQLAYASRLELGTPFEETDLKTASDGMRDLLQRNGLYLFQISTTVKRDIEHQQVAFTFRVNSGRRARLTLPVIKGDTRIPPDEVARAAGFRGWFRWKSATEDNVQEGLRDIRKLYNRQDRLTADITLDHRDFLPATRQVRATISVDGGSKIAIRAEGAAISKSRLQEYVPIYEEGTVNRDLLVTGVRNLREYFQNRGYFDVQVNFTEKDVTADRRDIIFTIDPGQRHRVVRVDIKGVHYFKERDIRERMYIHAAGTMRLRYGRYTEGFARRDRDAILALYRDNGFRDATVTIDTADDYKGKSGDVAVVITVVEGTQYLVSELTLDGVTRKDKSTIVALLASQPGQPFSENSVSIDRNYILELYQSAGFPDADFQFKTAPGPAPHQIAVVYTVTEGEQRFVRGVLISGLRTSRDRLIRPNILMKAGDPLSWAAMARMQRRFYDLGVFDRVDMAIQNPDGDTQNKYVLYHFTEGNRYILTTGFGAEVTRVGGSQTSLDNPTGTPGISPRVSFQVSRLNLWGLGHTLSLRTRYSSFDRLAAITYTVHRFHNREGQNITVTALYDNTRDVLTYTARRIEGAIQVSRRYSRATNFFFGYTWRNVQVNPNTLKISPELIPQESQPARVAFLSGQVIQDRRDNPADAHRGFYNSANLDVVSTIFGGNVNFLRFLGRHSYYKSIKPDWVLAFNNQFGWIAPFEVPAGTTAANYVPLPERLYGGGGNSNRGFPYLQAGPRDPQTGFPIGGNALLFHSDELRFPIFIQNMNGVLFHDMGNVYTDVGSISFRVHQNNIQDFNYMVHAVGVGLRYRTPIGPVRVDLAYSINPPTFFGLKGTTQQLIQGTAIPQIQSISHFQFFISIGQAF
jgi:outer membrane protein assembly complex protein YaeT